MSDHVHVEPDEPLAADGTDVPPGETPPEKNDPEALQYLADHGWPT